MCRSEYQITTIVVIIVLLQPRKCLKVMNFTSLGEQSSHNNDTGNIACVENSTGTVRVNEVIEAFVCSFYIFYVELKLCISLDIF